MYEGTAGYRKSVRLFGSSASRTFVIQDSAFDIRNYVVDCRLLAASCPLPA